MDNAAVVSVLAGISCPAPATPVSKPTQSTAPVSASRTPRRIGIRRSTADSAAKSKSRRGESPLVETTPKPFVCPICFDDTQIKTLTLLCAHQFCTGCWNVYVTTKIRDEGEHAIRCMAEGCSLVAPDPFIRTVFCDASDAPAWERYQELLVRHFVASNPNLKFCPYPSCTRTVSCPAAAGKSSLTSMVPTVSCGEPGHLYCFGCAIDADHRPIVCGAARMWLKKCRDDSETANWIKSNTKECSQCQSTIEKNGGCKCVFHSTPAKRLANSGFGSHMTCKKCRYEFCWVCMGKRSFLLHIG